MAKELCGKCHGLGCGVCFDGFVDVPEQESAELVDIEEVVGGDPVAKLDVWRLSRTPHPLAQRQLTLEERDKLLSELRSFYVGRSAGKVIKLDALEQAYRQINGPFRIESPDPPIRMTQEQFKVILKAGLSLPATFNGTGPRPSGTICGIPVEFTD